MSAKKLTDAATGVIGAATSVAGHVVRHPRRSAATVVGLVKGTAEVATGLARDVLGGDTSPRRAAEQAPARVWEEVQEQVDEPAQAPATTTTDDPRDHLPGPDVVAPAIPRAEDLPEPIVIEADDDGDGPGESFQTEPKAAGRESEHGGPAGDREEVEGYAEEVVATDAPVVDTVTPVGTTGADVGTNPDTAESDLQQPGTPPLNDPALLESVRSEAEVLQRDAERNPGE